MSIYQQYAAGQPNGLGGTYADRSDLLSSVAGYLASRQGQPLDWSPYPPELSGTPSISHGGNVASMDFWPPVLQGDTQTTAYSAMAWSVLGGFSAELQAAEDFLRVAPPTPGWWSDWYWYEDPNQPGSGWWEPAATHTAPEILQGETSRILGLIATGNNGSDPDVAATVTKVVGWQNLDGGWGEVPGWSSNAFATGQAVYALRQAGQTFVRGDGGPIDRGIDWLLANRIADPASPDFGAWPKGQSQADPWSEGQLFTYTMWPVLALTDVASVSILDPTGTVSGAAVPFRATTSDVSATTGIDFVAFGPMIVGSSTVSHIALGSDGTPDANGVFEVQFDSTTFANGTLTLKATATFANGGSASSTVTVLVDNGIVLDPVTLTAPADLIIEATGPTTSVDLGEPVITGSASGGGGGVGGSVPVPGLSQQFTYLETGLCQDIVAGPLPALWGPGFAWTTSGHMVLRGDTDSLFEYSLTEDLLVHGTPVRSYMEHPMPGLGYGVGLTNGTDGYFYANTSNGVARIDPLTWSFVHFPESVQGDFGMGALPDGRIVHGGYSWDGITWTEGIYRFDPATGSDVLIYSPMTTSEWGSWPTFFDDLAIAPTGEIFLAALDENAVHVIDANGNVTNIAYLAAGTDPDRFKGPDGIAFGNGRVFTNNTDGTISRLTFSGPGYTGASTEEVIASGGAYGDFAAVGPDGALYVSQWADGDPAIWPWDGARPITWNDGTQTWSWWMDVEPWDYHQEAVLVRIADCDGGGFDPSPGVPPVDVPLEAVPDQTGPFTVGVHVITWTVVNADTGEPYIDPATGTTVTATQLVEITDTTPPTILVAGQSVAACGPLTQVTVSANADDLVDGAVIPTNNAPAGGFPVGTTVVSWTATDSHNNTAMEYQNVTLTYGFGGFLPPLKQDGVYKLGRVIPVKIQLLYCDGSLVTGATPTISVFKLFDGDVLGDLVDTVSVSAADTGNVLRDAGDHYIYNLSTDWKTKGRYRLMVDLGDNGPTHTIDLGMR
ncbi:MAG: hypothetical protein ACE5FN_05785 [Leptospirillia bacterium]